VPLLHQIDQLADVLRRGGNSGLGFDVVDARNPKFLREVVPLFVIARHLFAAEDQALLEPAPQSIAERGAFISALTQEVEQLALPIEIGEGLAAQDRDELVAV